jgi:sulfur-oxidizing protein SoxY
MDWLRRDFLHLILGANACLLIGVDAAQSAPQAAFDTRKLTDLFAGTQPEESNDIIVDVAIFAEGSAQVPVAVTANVADVESISLIVENNSQPLAATLQISALAAPYFQTQVRLEKSSNVIAAVRLRNSTRLLFAKADVLVTSTDGCP